MARQPIFDRRRQVVGYELLFRNSLTSGFGIHDADRASLQVIDTTLLGFGRQIFFLARLLSTLDALLDRPLSEILDQMAISQEIHDALIHADIALRSDTLLGQPMVEALDRMPLPQEVRDTLLGRTTSMSPVWQLVLAYERAQWDQLKELGAAADVSVGRLPGLYRNAVQWVDRIHRM